MRGKLRRSGAVLALALAVAPPGAHAACGPDDPPDLPERNWILPIVEVFAFDYALWAIDHYGMNAPYSDVTWGSVGRNLRGGWWADNDNFNTNQFLHPYQGNLALTAGRAAGHGFWTSAGFAAANSLVWKLAGENGPPSWNDMIMNTLGGATIGEAMFRVSRLVLDRRNGPGVARRLGAFLIAPAAGLNDVLLDGRICDPDPPAASYRARLSFGAGAGAAAAREGSLSLPVQGLIGLSIDYGLPAEIELRAPFDHFRASLAFYTATARPWVDLNAVSGPAWLVSIEGILAGATASLSGGGRLHLGLASTFDYGGPILLRVSETGLGPTVVVASARSGPISAEAAFTAAATFGTAGGRVPVDYERDYRYGFGVLLAASGRLALGERLALEAGARAFATPEALGGGSEDLVVATGSAVLRLWRGHALAADAIVSRRSVSLGDSRYGERFFTVGLSYAYLLAAGEARSP